jgi:ABC-type multidrug transport system fused ATPase/permease subunit
MHALWRLLMHLTPRRRRQIAILVLLMIVGAAAELASIGAVLPFLTLLADPTVTLKYPLLQEFFLALGWETDKSILLPSAVLFGVVSVCAAALRMFVLWASFKFSFGVGVDFGVDVYRRVLHQPYSFHVAHNTSEIIAGLNKVETVVFNVVNPLLQGGVSLIFSIAILSGLIRIDPITASVAALGFAMTYLLLTISTRRKLFVNGKIVAEAQTKRVQAFQEGLGGIRDVIIDSAQGVYVNRFRKIDALQRGAQAASTFMGVAPRYLIESIGMVLIAALAYWSSSRMGGLSAAIPVLGALAIGAQKLIPQMQQIYYGWAALTSSWSSVEDVIAFLDLPISNENSNSASGNCLELRHSIALRNVCFRYKSDLPEVIRNLSLEIPRGNRVGFVGKTGSGKSTVVDLIMGLLEPTSGRIEIDGVPLTSSNHLAWRSRIAHVPQSIYLADATIAENIAFGIDPKYIDQERVRDAARKAQVAEFIETLPQRYEAMVGERGVRLSGGQRQRIGLARALYKRADVLVLDEATSALDEATEEAVMQSVNSLGDDVTVLMIAHRVSTVRGCDRIFELRNGSLLREVTSYEEIRL